MKQNDYTPAMMKDLQEHEKAVKERFGGTPPKGCTNRCRLERRKRSSGRFAHVNYVPSSVNSGFENSKQSRILSWS
jgi:hypothetical protein